MIGKDRIEKMGETIMQDSEGRFNASFKIQSETDHNVWYNMSWNMFETNPHKAFRCECMKWYLDSNKNGSCKHVAALSRKLLEEGRIPQEWVPQLSKSISS